LIYLLGTLCRLRLATTVFATFTAHASVARLHQKSRRQSLRVTARRSRGTSRGARLVRMQVSLVNDGPVTLLVDSRRRL
jgi:D-Tyr-tRNAtyr deacylase